MTPPPTLQVAREILADAAAKARADGGPFNEVTASAVDVVLAELERSSRTPSGQFRPVPASYVDRGAPALWQAIAIGQHPDDLPPGTRVRVIDVLGFEGSTGTVQPRDGNHYYQVKMDAFDRVVRPFPRENLVVVPR